jgi:hypothetical protein
MLWLSLLVLMLLISAAPGISIYVEHRANAGARADTPTTALGAEPHADGQRQAA